MKKIHYYMYTKDEINNKKLTNGEISISFTC